jgi:addiction module RelB/DinJ family antitoxin
MSKLLQIRVDDKLKAAADSIFAGMGLDTSTAVRMFLTAAVETRSLPFDVKSRTNSPVRASFGEMMLSEEPLPYGRGCMKNKMRMADDFDAPMEDFEEYM